MNDTGNRYALAAWRDKRAVLASEIVQLERQLRHHKESLGHVDATPRLLDPSVDIDALPNKRSRKRINCSGKASWVVDTGSVAEANGSVSTAAIVSGVLATGGEAETAADHGSARAQDGQRQECDGYWGTEPNSARRKQNRDACVSQASPHQKQGEELPMYWGDRQIPYQLIAQLTSMRF